MRIWNLIRYTSLMIFLVNVPLTSHSQVSLDVDYTNKSSQGIITIHLDMDEKGVEIDHFKIFIDEDFVPFPKTEFRTFNKPFSTWDFKKRESLELFGYDLRKPNQIFRKDLWTNGEVYTIGLEVTYINTNVDRAVAYILPFEIFDKGKILESDELVKEILIEEMHNYLPNSSRHFINNENEFTCCKNHQSSGERKFLIKHVYEYNRFFLLESDEAIIRYDKSASRPEVLGNSELLKYTLIVPIFAILCVLLIYARVIGHSILGFINALTDNRNKSKSVTKYKSYMHIEKVVNEKGSYAVFADKIEKLVFNENSNLSKSEFKTLKRDLKKMSSDQHMELINKLKIIENSDSAKKKEKLKDKFKSHFATNGIAIAENLSASAIYDVLKQLIL